MTSVKQQRSFFQRRRSDNKDVARIKKQPQAKMKRNKRLGFDSCSEEDLPRSSSPDRDNCKKLVFDDIESEALDFELSDSPSSPLFKPKGRLANLRLSPIPSMMMDTARNHLVSSLMGLKERDDSGAESLLDKFSPCHTRSGRIYTSVEKKKDASVGHYPTGPASKLPTPVFLDQTWSSSHHAGGAPVSFATPRCTRIQTSHLKLQELQLHLLQKDVSGELLDLDDLGTQNAEPPPLNHVKRPVSRFHLSLPLEATDPNSTWPLKMPANLHSPPTNRVKAMKLFDKSPSVETALPAILFNPRKLFGDKDRYFNGKCATAPSAGLWVSFEGTEGLVPGGKERKRKLLANVNPFNPTSTIASITKKFRSEQKLNHVENEDFFGPHQPVASPPEPDSDVNPAKRLRVSDINISRYEEEFVEIKEIASGSFGKVKVARHCLDGMLYAIKVTSNKIHCNTHEERVAMNEVFAHSSLMKHKHVVRYYNSWVENGRVYIQNEYCEGGSLAKLIKSYRKKGVRFTESELKRILLHIAKGLQYIHSKQLVHLDVKPENILIALDHDTPSPLTAKPPAEDTCVNVTLPKSSEQSPLRDVLEQGDSGGNESTDSGHASGCDERARLRKYMSEGVDLRISYKIGDLGHVVPIYGENIPEEGDCRYMAPELLTFDIDREKLPAADIFSLGLTLYEAASLQELPKNSIHDPMYERLKSGDLPFIEGYSNEFNLLLKSMVSKDEKARPSALKIVTYGYLRSNTMSKSRAQLYKELKETKVRLKLLEVELSIQKDKSVGNATGPSWMVPFKMKQLLDESSSLQSSPVKARAEKPFKKITVGQGAPKSRSWMM